MARGPMRWIGAVVLLCGGLAAWLLPPTAESFFDMVRRSSSERTPEEARARELNAEVRGTKDLLVRLYLAERFREALEGEEAADGTVIVTGVAATAPAAKQEQWRDQLAEELRRLPRSGSGTDVALFIQDRRLELPGGHGLWHLLTHEYFLIDRPSGPVCVVSVSMATPRRRTEDWWSEGRWELGSDRLGPCAFHAAHGVPGSGIARWLEGGGYLFAQNPAASERPSPGEVPSRRTIFGIGRASRWVPIPVESCLSGRLASCGGWITAPGDIGLGPYRDVNARIELTRRTDLIYQEQRSSGLADVHVMADLQAEFGPERFGQFWRSERPVTEAFTEAFGEAPGSWMHRWAVSHYGEVPAGPGLSLLTTVLSFLTVGATFLVAAYLTERRTVD